jgi:hypothetical protein
MVEEADALLGIVPPGDALDAAAGLADLTLVEGDAGVCATSLSKMPVVL